MRMLTSNLIEYLKLSRDRTPVAGTEIESTQSLPSDSFRIRMPSSRADFYHQIVQNIGMPNPNFDEYF